VDHEKQNRNERFVELRLKAVREREKRKERIK
jgi:hypothetical protein